MFNLLLGTPKAVVTKRLQSVRKPQSGAFLLATQTNPRLEMDNTTFSTALSLRLGVKPPLFAWGNCAVMGRIDDEGTHPHICRPVALALGGGNEMDEKREWVWSPSSDLGEASVLALSTAIDWP